MARKKRAQFELWVAESTPLGFEFSNWCSCAPVHLYLEGFEEVDRSPLRNESADAIL